MLDNITAPAWSNDLPPLAELVIGLAELDVDVDSDVDVAVAVQGGLDDRPDGGLEGIAELEEIRLSLAIELEVRDGDAGAPRVTGSTPTQWTATTILPSFHRIAIRITRTVTDA